MGGIDNIETVLVVTSISICTYFSGYVNITFIFLIIREHKINSVFYILAFISGIGKISEYWITKKGTAP